VHWDELEPVEGQYNFSLFDAQISSMRASNVLTGLQFIVGRSSPPWLMRRCGSFLTKDTAPQNTGPYPCYFEPSCSYNASMLALIQALADHFETTWGTNGKDQILYWHLSEGTTGDEFCYHGTPSANAENQALPPCGRVGYSVSASEWATFRLELWRFAAGANAKNAAWLKLLMNPGGDFGDLDALWAISPSAYTKDGRLSHQYGFNSEEPTFWRGKLVQSDEFSSRRERGELQQTFALPEWQVSPIKNTFALILSALSGNLDMLQYGLALFTDNTPDIRPLVFFDKYAPMRNPSAPETTRGFIAFRDVIDLADTARFPEGEYGLLIDPSRQRLYDRAMLNASLTAGPIFYNMRVSILTETYINPSRVQKIKDQYLLANGSFYWIGALDALSTNENNITFGDFGVNMSSARNYGRFVSQINTLQTSYGRFRCGGSSLASTMRASDAEMHGRYCREFNLSATPELRLVVDLGLQCSSGPSNVVWLNLTYYDDGQAGSFRVLYSGIGGQKQAGAQITKV
jgi:hypothetical protein